MRHLKLGYLIVGVDSSACLVAVAGECDPSIEMRLADAAALPFEGGSADLATAFMSLHDMDAKMSSWRMPRAVLE
jgi:ubiquinone/menaquinone biosynthesis C-methylase UbiE